VFIAYMAHDRDPDFMDATRQFDRAHRHYRRWRRPVVARVRQIKARLTKDIGRLEASARTKAADVAAERGLLEQVDRHESAILAALTSVVRGNAQVYHASLAQLAAVHREAITIERVGSRAGPLSIGDFRNEPVNVSPEMIRELG
jgi:hypothetical protein